MKFLTPLIFLTTLTAALPSGLVRRDGTQARADIAAIAAGVDQVQSDVNAVQPGFTVLFKALAVQKSSSALDKTIQGARDSADASAPYTRAESEKIAEDIVNLQPKINALLDSIVAKKPVFDKAIFGFSGSPLVKKQLTSQRQSTKEFGDATIKKLEAEIAALAPLVTSAIDQKFADALAAYQ